MSNGRVVRLSSKVPKSPPRRRAQSNKSVRSRSHTPSSEPSATKKTNPLAARRGLTKREREEKENRSQIRVLYHRMDNHSKEMRYHMFKTEECMKQIKKLVPVPPDTSDEDEFMASEEG